MSGRDRSELSAAKRALLEKRLRGKAKATGNGEREQTVIRKRTGEGPLPLSFAQQRLWFLDQLADGENTSYNVPFVWSLSGPLHLQALERSLNEIVRRHEALRTVFVEQGGEPRQVVLPDLHVALTLHDVQHIVETEEREEAARHLMQTEIYRPFDLSRGPLLRAALVQVEAQRYLFTLTLHHIVADGWSVGVLMREFTALYEAFAADLPSPLPDVKTQYPDFTLWQREQLQTEAMNKQFDYWRNQLGGSLPVLELPTDHPRPAKQTFQGAAEKFVLSPQQTTALKEIGQQAGATLFMTLLTAFNALLHRYTGSEDLLIGSPVANRQLPEIEEMIGFLVNTLVLRTDLSGDPTFLDALARVKRMSLDAFAHQDVPFEQLVADLQPERDLSQSPLFNAMFVLVNTELEPLRLGGLIMTPLAFEFETAKYDLTLTMTEEGDQLVGWLEYNTDLWTEATARRMVQHLQQLLQAVPVDPRQRLSDLTLLTAEEERLLLSDWVATDADYPADLCLHQLFEQQAERTPQAVAVTFGERSLTYRELDRLADAWAVRLQAIGVGPDRPVGLSMERSVEMIVALLGILKAGGAYVPLDPEYPQERLSAIMADAQLHALVTQPHLQDRLPTRDRPLLHLDLQELQLLAKGEVATASRVQPDDLAYIIYTSGSTGKPKGVAMVHRALTNLMHVHQQQNTLPPEARTLQFTSLNFDVSVQDIFSTLCTGGTLVLVSDETRRDTHALYRYLIEQRIERLFLPFVALRHLAEVGAVTELVPDTLREVITAGEQLQITPEMRRFFSRLPQCTLRNDYGPSETHVVSQLELTGDPAQWPYLPSIGKALPNVALYVLDANGKPVPLGVPGELYVGGEVALARGYWQRPDLTQERFVPNPFAKREGARLYKTGDLVRYLPHGELEFLARVDQQVKIRGHRVELGEVEAILSEHPLLRAAAVSAPEDERGLKRLVAYVVPLEQEAGTQTNWADICREYLAERLPDYMVPSLFVPLDALPVNANGKLDRKALPALDLHQQQERAFVPPRTETERQVAAVFSAVLGIAEVSAHDDFFHLGGHSLLATQVISRLREAFAVPLSLKVIFQASTVEILARAIKGQLSDQTAGTANRTATLKTIPTVSREGHMPLSFAQQRLWFLDQFEGGRSATYNMPFVTRLEGALDVDVLERCLHEILRRHEALRTSFQVVDGEAVQVIAECAPLRIERFDLRDVEESVREQEALQRIEQEAHRPFDLTAGPLLRASLVQVGDDSHILLINLHHIASDGWSIGVLGRELSALYAAFTAGEPSPLPDLPIQYADFASWQRENMQGAEMEEQLAYWKRQLGGTLPVLQLPTDHPRPPKQTFNGTVREFRLSRALTDRLKQFSEREQATLFMTLLSAFQTLLARYSGQDDILVGTPIANRRHSEVEGLIGFFANTLAMRTDLSGDPTFCELVQRVKQVALDGYAHQDLPFEKMVEELQPDRDLSQSPLFRVMFVLVNTPGEALRLGDVKLRDVEMEHRTAKFDLTLFLTEDEQGLRGAFEYNTDLYEDATIRRMTEHLETLLQAVVADPTRRISELPLLPEAEKESLLQAGLGLAVAEREGCVHDRVAQVAGRTPDAVAVRFGERAMSYAELERRANRLAQRLQAEGIGRGHLVGICLPRSVEMMISVLAVLKAGGAYVPLDPSYPQERIDAILEEADLSLILAHDSVLPLLEKGEVATLLVGDGEEDEEAHQTSVYETQLGTHPETHHVAQADQSWGLPPVAPDDPAYVLFTSGSTGKPKGVTMHHRALRNLIAWQEAQSGILPAASTATSTATAAANTLQFTSLNFDVSFQEIFATWCAGGTLVLVSEDVRRDPEALLDTLIDQEVERLFLPFVALQQLADAAVAQKRIPSQLREVNTAGEQLQITDGIRAFFTQLPNCRLVNQYGPTESHVVTAYRMQGPVENWPSLPPIGRPIHNAAIYLLDDHLQPVPTGVVGELHIGGVSVAQGYLNQPDLTADKFIPNPFGGGRHNGDRLYKTGDLARFLPNGEIEYLGRRDQQVKIRGYRIELGEIESVLRQHSDVREAVVTAHEEGTGLKRLVAYVVGDTAQDLLLMKRSLHQHLAAKLPSFMIPSAYQLLDRLPVTPTGKVDRRALPTPDFSDSFSEKEYVAPRNEHEEITAHVFSQLLGVAQVGAHDSFFQLGGHSLLATQAVSRLRDLFAVDLPLQTLFEAPTVAGLARELKRLQRSESGRLSEWEQQPIPRRSPDDPAVLSYAQQRIWFLDQFEDDTASYNVPYVFRLLGDVDVSALERSLNHIVERHEALRTVFGKREGTPVPVLLPELHLMIPVHDLRDLSPEQRAQQQHDLTQAEVYRPFDLTVGPLFRLTLLHLQAGEYRLILNMHHIVSDGWSIGVLMKELAVCYEAYASGQRPLLPELPLQYADYALWQRNWLQGDVLQEQLDYWKTKLGGTLPVLELPTDKPRPSRQTFRGTVRTFTLSPDMTARLNQAAQQEGATLFMVLLAAFQTLLFRYSGQDDIVVGTPIANRKRSEIESLIGFFVNTLALRTDLSGNPAFSELIGRVREAALGAYAHQDVPFEKLVEELAPDRDMSQSPLFRVMFVLLNTPMPAFTWSGVQLIPDDFRSETAKFDLMLFLTEEEGALVGGFEYNTDIFAEETIARMVAHLENLLAAVLADPQQKIGDVTFFTEQEERLLLHEWVETQTSYPSEMCIHQLVEAQAQQTPQATALVYGSTSLTYAELDRRATELARHLQARGVKPDALVGICLERSVEMIVAVLGTLKAGGAYVPLDPTYPEERLRLIVEDAELTVLLTEESLLAQVSAYEVDVLVLDRAGVQKEGQEGHSSVAEIPHGLDASPREIVPEESLTRTVTSEHLAYVLYTSGSTGQPKGVAMPHRPIANLIDWHAKHYDLPPEARTLQFTSLNFDVSVQDIFATLGTGGTLVLIDEDTRRDSHALYQYLIEHDIARIFLPFVALQHLAAVGAEAERVPTSLREVVTAGEQLKITPEIRRFFSRLPACNLRNDYGPTETHAATQHVLSGSPDAWPALPCIGAALQNVELYVLDANRQPVPMGVPGELYIGGAGVSRGYLNRDDLTAERYQPHPFAKRDGERVYKTGDLVRYLPHGELEYLARIDQQVKIRGHRVELGEVEAVLNEHPLVREAVVTADEDNRGMKRLVAYVVEQAEEERQTDNQQDDKQKMDTLKRQLRADLSAILPDYMVPTAFVLLEVLPLTATGKLDRKALPAIEQDHLASAAYVAPSTPTEEKLAQIWSEVLRVEQVGRHGHFFELGGHSLLATQVMARVQTVFGVQVRLFNLFAHPTLERLATCIDEEQGEESRGATLPDILPDTRSRDEGYLPLSFAQKRLWFLNRFQEGDDATYNMPFAFRLRGALHVAALEQSLQTIVDHHEALRTTFTQIDGEPMQVIHEHLNVPLTRIDLRELAQEHREAEAQQLFTAESYRPFDLEKGPLVRASLVQIGEADFLFQLNLHHIVTDGWSNGVLMRQLSDLYASFAQWEKGSLPELPIQYADYTLCQRDW
ncbi:MAG TPA: amino acid adenylation domain-containing protein, partial [Bacilli bacterium]|nr:amino acid adenylation domain-containing protein [Bacilli bacterium]